MSPSPNIAQLRPSATMAVSTLAKRLRAEGRDILDLSAGEPDFPTPDWIAQAGVEAIRRGATRYTPPPGTPDLRKAIAGYLTHLSGRDVDWNGVVVTAGAKQALFNTCFCLFGPGDRVLVAAPYWTSHPEIVTLSRAEAVPVAGPAERGFRLSPAELEAAWTPEVKGLVICSPSNPTGSVYSREELEAVARWAKGRNVWLISDEIYRSINFTSQGQATGLLDLPSDAVGPHVLVDGASKGFAMTGWRIGFTVSEVGLAKEMSAFQSHTTSNAAAPSQAAALEAYTDPQRAQRVQAELAAIFQGRRDLLQRLVREQLPGFSFVEPAGAFYLFFNVESDLREGEAGASDWCTRILEDVGVALVPGAAFGDDRYARLSYAASEEDLQEAIRRIASSVAGR
ncbi:MAG: pyridoxal phosphate-dependent aminotransferase [Gemmatimonadota bacterium]